MLFTISQCISLTLIVTLFSCGEDLPEHQHSHNANKNGKIENQPRQEINPAPIPLEPNQIKATQKNSNISTVEGKSDSFIAALRKDNSWILLSDNAIEKMKVIAQQAEAYTCGHNCAARVGKACDIKDITHTKVISDCPISLKITKEKCGLLSGFIEPILTQFNASFPLIIGPTPQMLCDYMNTKGFSKNNMKPVCIGKETIDTNKFIEDMKISLKADLPGIIHVSSVGIKTHYMVVVGITENSVSLLDTNGTFSTIPITELKNRINTSKTTSLVSSLEPFRGVLSPIAEKLPTTNEIDAFKPVSYICFQ